MTNKYEYITTAIAYPNNRIHIGFAWECVGADWLSRSHKLMGRPTLFVTGTDEHSAKVEKAAIAQGLDPQAYCNKMAEDIRKVLDQLGISYDRFIRTSDADHKRVVQALLKRAKENGDVYKAEYEGHYCEGCEAFYLEKDLVDGLCPDHKTKPQWIKESNYFFKLSKYQDAILKLLKDNKDFLQPEYRKNEMLHFVETGLKDFSISRAGLKWGIEFPDDPEHVVYVWFDALINYVTAAGFEKGDAELKKFWPASTHIIGKDVARFHCIYWPAMLMSLNLSLPKQVFAHGWMNLKGERMSKSTGNMITPDEVMAVTGPDALRYYLLAENQFSGDGNFAMDLLALKVNADLSNDFGNLVNRTINMSRKYFPNEPMRLPLKATHSKEIVDSFDALQAELEAAIRAVDPMAYCKACTARSRLLNLYIDKTKPWALAKAGSNEELKEVLFTLLEGIRWIATALLPVLPFKMPEVYSQLGLSAPTLLGAYEKLRWGQSEISTTEPKPIFPRIELAVDSPESGVKK